MGVFGYDTHNAIPLNLMNPTVIKYIKEVIQKYDRFFATSQKPTESWSNSILADLNMEMHNTKDQYSDFWKVIDWMGRQKLFALSFWDIRNNRMELRSVRPQRNIDVWLAQISLINARINYLAQFGQPIPFKYKVPVKRSDGPYELSRRALNPPIDTTLALKSFFTYVQESGEDWFDHRNYLWPDWIQSGEVDEFENSSWFKRRYVNLCERHL